MKLILLYGPPAVGKLTVAKRLSALTGFPVLHNHLTADYAATFFEWLTPEFVSFVDKLRLFTLKETADAGRPGLICTLVYAHPDDDSFIEKLEAIVNSKDGITYYVHLSCTQAELEQRVVRTDRSQHQKVTSVERLQGMLAESDLLSPIPDRESLLIDNSDLTAEEVARMIADHLRNSGCYTS